MYLLQLQQLESTNRQVHEHQQLIGQQRRRDRDRRRQAPPIRGSEKLTTPTPRQGLSSSLIQRSRLDCLKRSLRRLPSPETQWTRRNADELSPRELYLSSLRRRPSRRRILGGGTIFRSFPFSAREPHSLAFPSVEERNNLNILGFLQIGS